MSIPPSVDTALTGPDGEALDWFVRHGRGLDAIERAQFQAWLAADPRHAEAFASWQQDWTDLEELPAQGIEALRQELAAQKAAADAESRGAATAGTRAPRRHWSMSWLRTGVLWRQSVMAAAVLLVAGIGYIGWDYWQQQPIYTQSFTTARGQQLYVELPDGSRLRLDTATQVDVALYRDRREIRMPDGQAFFQVQSDAARPFDVLTGPMRVTVLGTSFSVRNTPAVPGKNGVHIEVEEGRVRVARADLPRSTQLVATDAVRSTVRCLCRMRMLSRLVPW